MYFSDNKLRTFAHIINPVSVSENADLNRLQEITFASMLKAKQYALDAVHVSIYTTQFAGSSIELPPEFISAPALQRSVCDIANIENCRKLPLIKDVLEAGYHASEAEYLIYTNLDICLMPQFYAAVNDFVEQGSDAFVINRRRVSEKYNDPNQLNQMYSEVGGVHTGYDTFVFKRSLLEKFVLKNLCLGVNDAGNDLFYNIFCFAENPKLYVDKHLTFHIGMELYKDWGTKELRAHNKSEFRNLLTELEPQIDISKFPGANLSIVVRHFKWLMNPTFYYPLMFKLDFKQRNRVRKPKEKLGPNTLKHRYLEWLIKFVNF